MDNHIVRQKPWVVGLPTPAILPQRSPHPFLLNATPHRPTPTVFDKMSPCEMNGAGGWDLLPVIAHGRKQHPTLIAAPLPHPPPPCHDAALSVTVLISRTLLFGLNVTLTSLFNFIVLLSYRAIFMFLVQKFSCPVATHGHEPSRLLMALCRPDFRPTGTGWHQKQTLIRRLGKSTLLLIIPFN